jgi:hypothetical protein
MCQFRVSRQAGLVPRRARFRIADTVPCSAHVAVLVEELVHDLHRVRAAANYKPEGQGQ